jgi:hypothetical protein
MDALAQNGMEVVEQIVAIYKNYDFRSQVLVASVRHPMHVLEAALLGADVATIPFAVVKECPASADGQGPGNLHEGLGKGREVVRGPPLPLSPGDVEEGPVFGLFSWCALAGAATWRGTACPGPTGGTGSGRQGCPSRVAFRGHDMGTVSGHACPADCARLASPQYVTAESLPRWN